MSRSATIICLAFALALVLTLLGCASAGSGEDPALIRGTGTMEHLDIEGGCWVIRMDDGRTLSPLHPPRTVQRNGLRVKLTARLRPDMMSACMAGELVEIVVIEPLSDKKSN